MALKLTISNKIQNIFYLFFNRFDRLIPINSFEGRHSSVIMNFLDTAKRVNKPQVLDLIA